MGGSRPARAVPNRSVWWWLAGAVALGLVITVIAVVVGRPAPAAPAPAGPTASPATSAPVRSATPTPTPTPTPTAGGTASPSPSATSRPTPTRAVQKEAYCKAFARIRTGSVSADSDGDGVDFNELADLFGRLITEYGRAAKAAPSSLDREYAAVLAYLKDMRQAVVSRDLDGIKLMMANLELLNEAMAQIEAESEQICG